ncbi:hypothetical protein K4L06_05540 [Lysobacter sp. BMK333-48F3]|uniref:hypothetical protein n=1 Tax=Lysobacter sp. BMK333-48F3 TaxID=2867962 RepID=UPI001C8B21C2|nr:hypothetical protein [Lysobacter sp. BMK333-48F3]MBX9400767.1 hypothetical protein [Lysobacter sp. BMK333-48F3]
MSRGATRTGKRTAAAARTASGPHNGEPDINIVNLSDTEFALLQALRGLDEGRIEVRVSQARIVEIVRSQRLPVAAAESWG